MTLKEHIETADSMFYDQRNFIKDQQNLIKALNFYIEDYQKQIKTTENKIFIEIRPLIKQVQQANLTSLNTNLTFMIDRKAAVEEILKKLSETESSLQDWKEYRALLKEINQVLNPKWELPEA